MESISEKTLKNIESCINKHIQVLYNEANYLTVYEGKLLSFDNTKIELLVKDRFKDSLSFFDGPVRKIFNIYTDDGFDHYNDRTERTMTEAFNNEDKLANMRLQLRKRFNKKMIAVVRQDDGKIKLVKGPLVEITQNEIRIQKSYIDKVYIAYKNLLELYDANLAKVVTA